jgi:phosphate transport system substrate-binding protein
MIRFSTFCLIFIASWSLSFAKTSLPIVGTGDGIALFRALAQSFSENQETSEVKVPPSIGSGGGINTVLAQQAILGRVARKLKPEEAAKGLEYLPLATIPTVFFIHKGVRLPSLTISQIADIYQGKIRNWEDVGGVSQKIRIVRRENGDSSLEALKRSLPAWQKLDITERTKTATSTQEAIDTVTHIEGTIGFGPYSNRLNAIVNVLKLDGLAPLEATYPANVEIALIYKPEALTNEAKAFLEFLKTTKAQDIIIQFGAKPLSP